MELSLDDNFYRSYQMFHEAKSSILTAHEEYSGTIWYLKSFTFCKSLSHNYERHKSDNNFRLNIFALKNQ